MAGNVVRYGISGMMRMGGNMERISMQLVSSMVENVIASQEALMAYVQRPEVKKAHPHWFDEQGRFMLQQFMPIDFVEYIQWKLTSRPSPQLDSTQNAIGNIELQLDIDKLGLFNLYRQQKIPFSKVYDDVFTRFLRHLKTKTRQKKSKSEKAEPKEEEEEEKEVPELYYDLYHWLCTYFVQKGDIWSWLFCTLTWNTLNPPALTALMTFQDLTWEDEFLVAQVPHPRPDAQPLYITKYIFGNPTDPIVSPVMALGIYVMVKRLEATSEATIPKVLLFPEKKATQIFEKKFDKAFCSKEGKEMLKKVGFTRDQIQPQSITEGAIHYCTRYHPHDGPNIRLILRRANPLINARVPFFKEEDQHIARMLSGLPLFSPQFSAKPAFFPTQWYQSFDKQLQWKRIVRKVFPCMVLSEPLGLCDSILAHCLASMVDHIDFLKKTIGIRRKSSQVLMHLRYNPLTSNKDFLRSLLENLRPRILNRAQAPGVPAFYASIKEKLDRMTQDPTARRMAVEKTRNPVIYTSNLYTLETMLDQWGVPRNMSEAQGLPESLSQVLPTLLTPTSKTVANKSTTSSDAAAQTISSSSQEPSNLQSKDGPQKSDLVTTFSSPSENAETHPIETTLASSQDHEKQENTNGRKLNFHPSVPVSQPVEGSNEKMAIQPPFVEEEETAVETSSQSVVSGASGDQPSSVQRKTDASENPPLIVMGEPVPTGTFDSSSSGSSTLDKDTVFKDQQVVVIPDKNRVKKSKPFSKGQTEVEIIDLTKSVEMKKQSETDGKVEDSLGYVPEVNPNKQELLYRWPSDLIPMRRLPFDFTFFLVPPKRGWVLWHFGAAGLPRLKTVRRNEIGNVKERSRLSAWKYLMDYMDGLAKQHAAADWEKVMDESLCEQVRIHLLEKICDYVLIHYMEELNSPEPEIQWDGKPLFAQKRKADRVVTTMTKLVKQRLRKGKR